MSIIEGILLGIVQGLTEFLPVSSSGHLAMANILGIANVDDTLPFFIILHLGTLLAVLAAMRKDLLDIITGIVFTAMKKEMNEDIMKKRGMVIPIIITTAVTVCIAFPLKKVIENSYSSAIIIGVGFIITSCMIIAGEYVYRKTGQKKKGVSIITSIIVGAFQGITPFPGVSRSGTTICAGCLCGIEKQEAVRYSFLIAIPAILGALVLDFKDITQISFSPAVITGLVCSFVSGYAALRFLFWLSKTRHYLWFGLYTFILGLATIIYSAAS